jgi:hypothetical protein
MTARLVAAGVTGLVLVGCTSADPQRPSREREQTNPLELAICEAGRTPWPVFPY